MMGRERSSRVVAETVAKIREMKELQEEVGNFSRKGRRRTRREALDEIRFLSSEQSLEECSSFLKAMCGGDEGELEKSHSPFAFESLRNLHLRM